MSKFISCTGDLRFGDGELLTFGDGLDSSVWWDGTELRLNTTISGVDPTQSYHLTTKSYVDSEIATVSGYIITDHGNLSGLGDDDHAQYVPTDGSRGFTSTVSGVDPTQGYHLTTKDYVDNEISTLSGSIVLDHGGLTGLADDDHLQYVPTDGSRGFTSTVSGVDPVQDYHLATKWYVDDEISTLSGSIVLDHGDLTGLGDDDHTQYILVDGTRAFTGTVGGITPTADSHLTTKQYVDSLVQGLDWQDSVIDIVPVSSGIAAEGNRYIASTTSGTWTEDYIYEYISGTWSGTAPDEGMATWVENEDYLVVYNGTDWVRFGTTVTHNYLNGLQGGTTSQYYHLTSTQHTDLTSVGGVGDAGSQHHHDGRYYTETEIDTTLSGYSPVGHTHTSSDITDFTSATQAVIGSSVVGASFITVSYNAGSGITTISGVASSIDHGGLSGLGDDDHILYVPTDGSRGFTSTVSGIYPTQDYHLATKYYVDYIVSTISGGTFDHGSLTGLLDDDHPQYVPTDGSRGFTSTVSGIEPVQNYHLATKGYVDGLTTSGSIDRSGRTNVPVGTCYVDVNFADIGTSSYILNATLENVSDSPPSIYAFIITNKTSSSFRVDFMGDMDSANYYLNWTILAPTV